jgi:hypothetical protein
MAPRLCNPQPMSLSTFLLTGIDVNAWMRVAVCHSFLMGLELKCEVLARRTIKLCHCVEDLRWV